MGQIIGAPFGLDRRHPGAHDLIVFVVHACRQTVLGDLGEGFAHQLRRDAGEPVGMGVEGREFEGANAGLNLFGNAAGALFRVDGAVKRHVNMGFARDVACLFGNRVGVADQRPLVERHIDDSGNSAAGGCSC